MTVPSFDQVMSLTSTVSSPAAFSDAECRAYYDLLCSLDDWSCVVEIGLQFGRSSSIVMQLQQAKRFHYIGVDPFTDPPEAAHEWMRLLFRTKALCTLMPCRTSQVIYWPNEIQLALIDGDHEASAVNIDCAKLLPRIGVFGYALFHDYGRASLPDVYPTVQACMKYRNENYNIGWRWRELRSVDTLGIWRFV